MKSIWHYKDHSYWFSIEEEEDNRKIYHYAYGPKGSFLLNFSPYDQITESEFKKLVDDVVSKQQIIG
jgi:hypothetical protein